MKQKILAAAAGAALALGLSGAVSADNMLTDPLNPHAPLWTAETGLETTNESTSDNCPTGGLCTRIGGEGSLYSTNGFDFSNWADLTLTLDVHFQNVGGCDWFLLVCWASSEGLNFQYSISGGPWVTVVRLDGPAILNTNPTHLGYTVDLPPTVDGQSDVRLRFYNDSNENNERAFIGPLSIDGTLVIVDEPGSAMLTGSTVYGGTLTVAVSDPNGTTGTTDFSYSWDADGTPVGSDAPSYDPQLSDLGKMISVNVTYTDDDGFSNSVDSNSVGPITAPQSAGAVSIDIINPEVGNVLTATVADADGISGVINYQWLSDGAPIAAANAATYTVQLTDVGTAISVNATYTDDYLNAEDVTSAATALVPEPPPPNVPGQVVVTGVAEVGQTLSVAVSDADGLLGATINYAWFAGGFPVGANMASYDIQAADANLTISVNVTYVDDLGNTEFISSLPQGPVVEPTEPPTEPPPTPAGCVYNPDAGSDTLYLLLLAAGLFYGLERLRRKSARV